MAELDDKGAAVAVARVDTRQLLKTMHWYDGFVVALANPGFIISSLGYTMGSIGALGALAVWAGSMVIGVLQNKIFTEPATMFPDRSGGISIYAYEGWRSRFSLAGPMAAIGYWAGWTAVLSIFGLTIGSLIQAQWFSGVTWSVSAGIHLDLPHVIAIVAILLVWTTNTLGMRPTKIMGYLTGGLLMVPLVLFMIVPFFLSSYHGSNLSFGLFGAGGSAWGIFRLTIAWLYLNGWSAYGVEVCATFAPEYHDTRRDTTLALRSAAVFTLLVFLLFPLGIGGVSGAPSAATASGEFYVPALAKIVGSGAAQVILVLLIGSLFLSMISSTADGSRALYGIARDHMTVKQLYHLNRFHVPARAMTVDLVVNVLLVLFISSNLAILYMSNIGYVLAHVFALSGFLLLRRDRPNWPRPIKVGPIWLGIAAILVVFNAALVIFGIFNPTLTGYGTWTDMFIGVGVLVASVLLYFYRRIVQDKAKVTFRDEVPTMPSAEQMALLRQEAAVAAD
jgi:amino acid transporter